VTLLAQLVDTSNRVSAAPGRTAKVAELAACLRSLAPEEIEIAVLLLSGEIPQGRSGIGPSALRAAAAASSAHGPGLSVLELDRRLEEIAAIRGTGSSAQRSHALCDLFSLATLAEQDFLMRLLLAQLRQGALTGVMIDAIAVAAALPVSEVRRAAMYSGLRATARVALLEGIAGLRRFQLEILSPLAPMLAQTAADTGAALQQLQGEVAFEWKMDGAHSGP